MCGQEVVDAGSECSSEQKKEENGNCDENENDFLNTQVDGAELFHRQKAQRVHEDRLRSYYDSAQTGFWGFGTRGFGPSPEASRPRVCGEEEFLPVYPHLLPEGVLSTCVNFVPPVSGHAVFCDPGRYIVDFRLC